MRRRPHGGRRAGPPFWLSEGGLAGAGLGIVFPGDILAYRAMWDQYVLDTVRVCYDCSEAFANVSVEQNDPTTAQQLAQLSAQYKQDGDKILAEWNVWRDIKAYTIVLQAADILEQEQQVVLSAGKQREVLTTGTITCALTYHDAEGNVVSAIQGADPNVQAQIIARIEGLGILGKGVLQIFTESTAAGVQAAGDAAQWLLKRGKEVVETTTSYLPWIIFGIAAIGVTGVALVYAPEIKAAKKAITRKAAA
jgi:hypothetical protein